MKNYKKRKISCTFSVCFGFSAFLLSDFKILQVYVKSIAGFSNGAGFMDKTGE